MLRCPPPCLGLILGLGLALVPFDWTVADLMGHPLGAAFAQDDDDDDDGGDDDDDDGGGGGGGGGGGTDDGGGGGGGGGGGTDDGGDDDDRGAGGGVSQSSGGGNAASATPRIPDRVTSDTPAPRKAARKAVRKAPPPPAFAPEIVVSDLSTADLDLLRAEGFTLIERRQIVTLALTLDRLAPPRGMTLTEARDRVRTLTSGRDADFNHYYRSSAADCTHENCPAWQMVGWDADGPNPTELEGTAEPDATPQQASTPAVAANSAPPTAEPAPPRCGPPVAIGVIDTGINPDHEILKGAKLTLIPRGDGRGSGAVHGTAVVSLLVGREGSRVPGLVPGAEVLAVDVFRADQGEERADVVDLVEGMDLLAGRGVRLYALSLAGPENTVLIRMLDRLTDPANLDAVIVAAAGNGGPGAEAAWPAAHPAALAVTAVDRRGRVYSAAQRGAHLALAAPGVGLLAATSVRGARAKSGTSFAVPFVASAAALLMGSGASAEAVRKALTDSARDLGAPGRDPVFGHGLLSVETLCGGRAGE